MSNDGFDSAELPNAEELYSLSNMVGEMLDLDAKIVAAVAALDALNARRAELSTVDIPAMMDQVGLSSIAMADGRKVNIKRTVRASVNKENEQAFFAWLREHNLDSIIKNEVSVRFGRGEDDRVKAVTAALKAMEITPSVKASVHFQTLQATVRELMAAGTPLPDSVSIFEQTETEVV